jgi:hypothetical protein
MRLVSQTTKTVTYEVPASTFSIAVEPITQAYVTVYSPPSAKNPEYATVITKAKSGTAFVVHQSASVVLAAQVSSLKIFEGGTTYGTVTSPKIAVSYLFEAKS